MLGKIKILIVDDDLVSLKMTEKFLQKKGLDVLKAKCGKECLEAVEKNHFDMVLLDMLMPDMNGDEVLQEIRKKFSSIDLPVIMVTGQSDAKDTVQALQKGANDYIIKPFNLEIAWARINTQLKLRELHLNVVKLKQFETIRAMIVTYNHEINNPLTVALSNIKLLKRDDGKIPLKERFESVERALYRVADIVKEIDKITSQGLDFTNYGFDSKMVNLKKSGTD